MLLNKRKYSLDYNDHAKRQNTWKWAILWYAQAVPVSTVSFIIYWFSFNGQQTEFDTNLNKAIYPAIRTDIKYNLRLFNDFKNESTWRLNVVDACTWIPLVCLFIEFLFGKLKIPLN